MIESIGKQYYKYSECMMWVAKCIKSVYVKSLACVRVKGYESECFRIDSGVKQMRSISIGSLMYIRMH